MAAAVWEDERVVRGMGVHLQAQRDKGGTRIGWKMGLGLPARSWSARHDGRARRRAAGRDAAGVRRLAQRRRLGAAGVRARGRRVRRDRRRARRRPRRRGGRDRRRSRPRSRWSTCRRPRRDPGAVLEGGFAHRAVILGAQDASRAGGDLSGLSTTVTANGEPFAAEEDPQGAVGGDILGLVRHAADYLGAFGERLEAGQFLITGSTIAPPPQVEAGQHLVYELGGIGTVEVTLT